MPIYEFACSACGDRFEELCAPTTETASCPGCGSERAARVLSAPAPSRRLTLSPGAARKSEDKRGTDRGGAMQRFREQRRRERGGAGGDGGG